MDPHGAVKTGGPRVTTSSCRTAGSASRANSLVLETRARSAYGRRQVSRSTNARRHRKPHCSARADPRPRYDATPFAPCLPRIPPTSEHDRRVTAKAARRRARLDVSLRTAPCVRSGDPGRGLLTRAGREPDRDRDVSSAIGDIGPVLQLTAAGRLPRARPAGTPVRRTARPLGTDLKARVGIEATWSVVNQPGPLRDDVARAACVEAVDPVRDGGVSRIGMDAGVSGVSWRARRRFAGGAALGVSGLGEPDRVGTGRRGPCRRAVGRSGSRCGRRRSRAR
jgi:hypothetical protein